MQMARMNDIDELFRLYYRPLCLYATHYLQSVDAAEDVVQEAFVALWEKMKAGEGLSLSKAYLSASVRNACIDILRRKSVHPESILPEDAEAPITDEEALFRAYDEAWLWTAIESLPEGRRRMLMMHRRDGLKYSEIAERLGVSERTVRNQISRAMKTLREKAKRFFLFIFA